MDKEREEKALKILQQIGYDNDSITQTEMWIALELDNYHKQESEGLREEWVSVDSPPKANGIYIIWDNGCDFALFHNGIWKTTDKQNGTDDCCGIRSRQTITPTAWAPLPSPPHLNKANY